jgi:hypothetical protein
MTLDADRRASLVGAKLGALVRAGWPDPEAVSEPADGGGEGALGEPSQPSQPTEIGGFALGATGRRGSVGWVLVDEQPERGLGPALAWARQHQVDELHVLVDRQAGVLARRAEAFLVPPSVWQIVDAGVVAASPVEVTEPSAPPAAALEAAALMADHGLEIVVEHGQVTGELRGLEVAQVVLDVDGSARIEVGVGRHDREAFAMLHADAGPDEALQSVIETVATHRRAGADPHPLNRMASARWLRSTLVDQPDRVGAVELMPVPGVVARSSVKESRPEGAVGVDEDGEPIVVVASTGIDLDLVPTAADLRTIYAPSARLVLVVPERDAHPVTRALADALARPAELVALPGDWRD